MPSITTHPAIAKSCPHWPGETQVPGRKMIAKTTPKVAGLNRCFPRNWKIDFEEIATAAAIGCAKRLSARSSSVRLRQVMIALRYERGFDGFRRQSPRCISKQAAKVRRTWAGRILKSRKYAPAESRIPSATIWKTRGSLSEEKKEIECVGVGNSSIESCLSTL